MGWPTAVDKSGTILLLKDSSHKKNGSAGDGCKLDSPSYNVFYPFLGQIIVISYLSNAFPLLK